MAWWASTWRCQGAFNSTLMLSLPGWEEKAGLVTHWLIIQYQSQPQLFQTFALGYRTQQKWQWKKSWTVENKLSLKFQLHYLASLLNHISVSLDSAEGCSVSCNAIGCCGSQSCPLTLSLRDSFLGNISGSHHRSQAITWPCFRHLSKQHHKNLSFHVQSQWLCINILLWKSDLKWTASLSSL